VGATLKRFARPSRPTVPQTRWALRASTSCGVALGFGAGVGFEGALPAFFFLSLVSFFSSAAALRLSRSSVEFLDAGDEGGDAEEPPDCPLRLLFPPGVVEGLGAVGELWFGLAVDDVGPLEPVAPATLTVSFDDLPPPPHEASSITSANGTNAIVPLRRATQLQG
jgi:hypothetical protein